MQHDGIIFYTATCLNWHHLLRTDERKKIILESLRFLVSENRIYLYAFVIMPNHIHLIWRVRTAWIHKDVQQMFMKFTAQKLKFHLQDHGQLEELKLYESSQTDREYQIWERRPFKAEVVNRKIGDQKLDYIHDNPVKAGLCQVATDYFYSSARWYEENKDDFGILTHLYEHI
jgi:putative transposase